MKRLLITLTASIMLISFFFITNFESSSSFEDFITNHEFHPSNRQLSAVKNIPRRDRPDLAWEQNFLMTLDPKLKRPAPERLTSARNQIKEYFSSSSARTGTQEHPWVERGPSDVGGRTRAIMWDPNDATGKKVWAGGVSGGLWYNENIYDENEGWQKVDDFWDNLSITAIASDPNAPETFYVGTGEGFAGASRGAGVWKSTDGGQSWNQLSATLAYKYILDLVVRDENGTSVLYFGTKDYYYAGKWHDVIDGLFRSTDGGVTFDQVMPNVSGASTAHSIADIELDVHNNLWVGTIMNSYNAGGGTILYSTDGLNWQVKTQRDGSRMELACAPSDANTVYALVENNGKVSEIIKTTDGGSTWQTTTKPNDADEGIASDDFSRGQAWYDLIAAVDPNDANTLIVGAVDLFKSTDAGANWTQLSHWWGGYGYPYVHADQHAIVFKPGSSTDVLFGHDGGVTLSTDLSNGTPSFTHRNKNYNVTQFYTAAIHPDAGKDYFLAGSQDNGTQKFTLPGFGKTTEPTGGDGAFCFIDQTNGDIQITSYVQNAYYLSTNGGSTFNLFVDDETTGRFINPAAYDSHKGILYTAVSKSKIGRFTGIKSNNPVRNDIQTDLSDLASALTVSPYTTSSTTLYVGTGTGSLYKISNANTSSPITTAITGSNFPNGYISCIALGASEDQLLTVFSNYGINSLYESTNGGTSWQSKEGNLPDMPIRWAVYNPNDYNEVILATELGIWRTTNFNASSPVWTPSNEGLANVRVDMLQIRASDHEVIAATHGRGLYSSSGFSTGETLAANFSASATSIFTGESVTFSDLSTGTPTSWSWTFTGGSPATSSEQNPTVTYPTAGVYDVSLTITDQQGTKAEKSVAQMITVETDSKQPNLALSTPSGWDEQVTVYTKPGAFEHNEDFSHQDEAYLAYALTNTGVKSLGAAFKVEVKIDGAVVRTESWDEQIDINAIWYSYDFSLGMLSEGVHTITVTLDIDNEIEETNENDNVYTKTIFVQQSCPADNLLTDTNGTISDGSGTEAYLNSRNCSWTIAPKNARSITLSFSEFDTEKDTDFLEIFDGNNLNTPISSLSGSSIPADITVNTSEVMLVFTSNSSVRGEGWSLEYSTELNKPDLKVAIQSAEQIMEEIAVSLLVSNDGLAEMETGSTVGVYLSKDNQITADDTKLHTFTTSALSAKTDEVLAASIAMDTQDPGAYFLIAQVDDEELLDEESETNNEAFLALDLIILSETHRKGLSIFPNPAREVLYISRSETAPTQFELSDVSGKVIRSGSFSSSEQLYIADLKAGMYLLTISDQNGKTQTKIIKE